MEEAYNKHSKPTVYTEGKKVWMHNDIRKIGECSILRNEFLKTPFKIIQVVRTHNLKLQNTVTGKIMKNLVHVDRVKHVINRKTDDTKTDESMGLVTQQEDTSEQEQQSTSVQTTLQQHKESENTTITPTKEETHDGKTTPEVPIVNNHLPIDNVYEVEKLVKQRPVFYLYTTKLYTDKIAGLCK